jgi:hypothetical protein
MQGPTKESRHGATESIRFSWRLAVRFFFVRHGKWRSLKAIRTDQFFFFSGFW